MRLSLIRVCLFAMLFAAPAHAESDWFASLFTGEGTELRADERVFTLFSLLNTMGYDAAPVSRGQPIPHYLYHPVRQQVRARLLSADPDVRKQADAFFDAHPQSLVRYLAYVVNGGPPPFQVEPKSKELSDLKGFEGVLAKAYSGWKLEELMGSVQGEYRKALKGYLTAIDGPMGKARKLLKVPEGGPQSLVVLNLLEAQNEVRGVMGDNEVVVVAGPSEHPNVEGVVREYARVFIEPQVSKRAQAGWGGGASMLREAQLRGAAEQSVGEYASSLLARAVALKAVDAPDAVYESAAQKGYFGLKELGRGFDEGRPLEGWALEALGRLEARVPGKK